jgi:hypothetical protein
MQLTKASSLLKRPILRWLFAVAAALLVLLPGSQAWAQSTQGSILGTVKDQAGAVIPGATISLLNTDEGASRSTTSNSSGDFVFLDAKAGHYTVTATRDGFEKSEIAGFVLEARQQLRIDPVLTVGTVQQEVKVSGDSVTSIETDTPTIGGGFSSADVSNLPVNTRASAGGTSPLGIVGSLPGVQADRGNFSLQGGLPFQTEVSVDGITVQNASGNSPIADAFPSSESISEIRADGAQANPEFGQPGQVVVTTKGGTNNIHGAAFWYYQSSAFDAIPYTNPITTTKPKLVANTFGGSFGGPVVIPHFYDGHNRTFIFGAYEGWRHPSQVTNFYKVPSTGMKTGDFSKYEYLDANGNNTFAGLNNPFTGGSYGTTIPSVNAAAAKLLSFYPDPNIGDPSVYIDNDGKPNYQANQDSSGHSDQFDIRADQYFGANQKFLLWGRFTWKNYPINTPEPLLVPSAQNTNNNRVLKISANYSITPHIIDEFSFGFTRNANGKTNSFDGKAFTQGLGLVGLQNLFYNGIPELDFNNVSALNADRLSSVGNSNTYVYFDNLTWEKGNHQLKFGGNVLTLQAVSALGFNGSDNYGTFQYNTKGSTGLFTGVDFADFLVGLPNQTFYDVVSQDNNGKSAYYNFFGQDQWKVSPHLTLTYGLRYELHPGYYDVGGDIGNFDPSLALSGRSVYPNGKQSLLAQSFLASANACDPDGVNNTNSATINGAPCMPVVNYSQANLPRGLRKYPHLRFMPRFGFAYQPFADGKTVVRGGFGMYNITLTGSSFYSLTGTLQASTTQYTNTYDAATHAIGYQWPNIYAGAGNSGGTTNYGQDYFGTANSVNWKDPYTEQFSFSVDHDFGSGYAGRISYIGSETRQLVYAPDENTLPFSSTTSAYNQPLSARLFPNWGRINTRATGANESYQSVQVDFSHRFQHGLEFDSAYTFARALADNQGPANIGFAGQNGGSRSSSIIDRAADFGNVYGTRRNHWNTTATYDLPVGRGRMFGSDMPRLLDEAVGGWRLASIFLWQSGPFESPYFDAGQGDPSGTGSGLTSTGTGFDPGHRTQEPDKATGISLAAPHQGRGGWVNPAAYTCPGDPNWAPGVPCATGNAGASVTDAKGNVICTNCEKINGTIYTVPNPIGRFGNAGVGSIQGPSTINLSAGLSKTFSITEGLKLRAEGTFTNVLNHTNLGDPNLDISNNSFGQVLGTINSGGVDYGGARTGQVSLRLDF